MVLDETNTAPYDAAISRSEAATATRFDAALEKVGMFHAYTEVRGTLIRPNPLQELGRMRIDRILLPTQELLDMGWTNGAIGVELKSDYQATRGTCVSQALDYKNSVWRLPFNTVHIWLNYVFIYPMEPPNGQLESVMAQQHIGAARTTAWNPLRLRCGPVNIFTAHNDGRVEIANPVTGRKVGSR